MCDIDKSATRATACRRLKRTLSRDDGQRAQNLRIWRMDTYYRLCSHVPDVRGRRDINYLPIMDWMDFVWEIVDGTGVVGFIAGR